jgi:transcriptional regulator with XRE-family HTH domain
LFDSQHKFKFVMMDIKKKFGQKIKDLRLAKCWSQEKLAQKADLDRTYITGIETGKRNVSIVVIEKLGIALNVKLIELLNFNN